MTLEGHPQRGESISGRALVVPKLIGGRHVLGPVCFLAALGHLAVRLKREGAFGELCGGDPGIATVAAFMTLRDILPTTMAAAALSVVIGFAVAEFRALRSRYAVWHPSFELGPTVLRES